MKKYSARLLIFLFLPLAWAPLSNGQESNAKHIRIGIFQRTFDLYPELKGRVWGFSVIADVYEAAGYTVELVNIPIRRIPTSLLNDNIDVAWGSEESLMSVSDSILRSTYPISSVPFMIYYDHRNNWQPSWPPNKVFTTKVGVSTQASRYLKKIYGLQINQTTSFNANLRMVNLGRADYCIEHTGGFGSATPGLQKSHQDGFAFEMLYYSGIYAWFKDSQHGKILLEDFNNGLIELLAKGKLGKSYCYKISCPVEQEQVSAIVDLVNKEIPALNLPPQPVE